MTEINWIEVTSGLEFPEGPVALTDGSLLVVEIKAGRLTQIAPSGEKTVIAQTGGGPNGAAIGPDGRCYVCNNGGFEWHEAGGLTLPGGRPDNYSGGRIEAVDLATGEVEVLYTECDGAPLLGPNDLVFDEAGGFYFTDTGKHDALHKEHGALYYALADGSSIRRLAAPFDQPNGCALSADGKKLYLAETVTARLWAFDVDGPGEISAQETPFAPGGARFVYGSPRYEFFDSMAMEQNGNCCVATLLSGGISVIEPGGTLSRFVPGPGDPGITNLCFSPSDPTVAYITASATGRVYKGQWPAAGLIPHFNP